MNTIKRIIKEEDGYGTVEMILIIAGVGLLATGIFNTLQGSLATNEANNSAVDQVAGSIDGIIKEWNK